VVQPPAGTAGAYAMLAPIGSYSMTGVSSGAAYSSPRTCLAGVPTSGMTYSSTATSPRRTVLAGIPTSAAAPTMTMMGSSATYGVAQAAMPVQTYTSPTTVYSTSTPVNIGAGSTMSTTSATVMPTQTCAAPAQTSPPSSPVLEPVQTSITGGQTYGTGGAGGAGPYKLAVTIMQAQNLKHLNHFTGDKPYVVCEVKHNSRHERRARVQTKEVTIGDTSNPQWNECLELEPWYPAEKLEFTIYDKGLLGSRKEGKAELPGEMFHTNSNGWTGVLPVENNPQMTLQVAVRVLGPSTITA